MRITVALHTTQRRVGSITGALMSVSAARCSARKSIRAFRTIRERVVRFAYAYSFNQVTRDGSQLMLKLVTGGANAFLAMRPAIFDVGGDVEFGATVRAGGRDSVFVHTTPPTSPYKTFNNYAILKRCLPKKQKKKETVTRSYISFNLINKYN